MELLFAYNLKTEKNFLNVPTTRLIKNNMLFSAKSKVVLIIFLIIILSSEQFLNMLQR